MHTEDEKFMRLALEQAEIALKNDWIPIGAVFVRGSTVIHGRKNGVNHPFFDHAEHNGCYQALWSRDVRNLKGFTAYATLEPCIMCLSMLMTTRVSRIVYGLEDPYGGGSFMLSEPERLPARFQKERPSMEGGVLQNESKMLLREFFSSEHEGSRAWSDSTNPLVQLVMG